MSAAHTESEAPEVTEEVKPRRQNRPRPNRVVTNLDVTAIAKIKEEAARLGLANATMFNKLIKLGYEVYFKEPYRHTTRYGRPPSQPQLPLAAGEDGDQ